MGERVEFQIDFSDDADTFMLRVITDSLKIPGGLGCKRKQLLAAAVLDQA